MAYFNPPSKPQGGSYRSLFNTPVTRFLASAKNQITGVILPLHDWEYHPNTPEFRASYKPYRDAQQRDAQGHPALLPIGAFLHVHKNIGRKEEDFVSPHGISGNLFVGEGPRRSEEDPIIDMINVIRDEKHRYHWLSKDGSGPNGRRLLSFPGKMVVMNVLATSSKTPNEPPKVGLLTPSNSALVDYEHQMNVVRPPMIQNPRDVEWPDYLYGDVTHPNHPVLFNTMVRSNPTNPQQTYTGFFFSNNTMSYDGLRPGPVIGADLLSQRLNIFDPALYNFLVYQELVDLLVADNMYPLDLIQESCGGKANIGGTPALGIPQPMPQAAPHWQPGGPPQQQAPANQWGQPAPQQAPANQWGQPAPQQAPTNQWGQPAPQQAPTNQWGQPAPQQQAPADQWGQPTTAAPNPQQNWAQSSAPEQQQWGQPAGFKTDAWAQPAGLAAELAQPPAFSSAPPAEPTLWLIEQGQQPREMPRSQAAAIALVKPGQVGICLTGPQGPFVTPEAAGLLDSSPQGAPPWVQQPAQAPPTPANQWGPPAGGQAQQPVQGAASDNPFTSPPPQQEPVPQPQMQVADTSVYEAEYSGRSKAELQQELTRVSSLMVSGGAAQIPDAMPRLGWLQAQINK